MKSLLAWFCLTGLVWAKPDSLVPPDPGYTNAFATSNPGYRRRAAESYERTYFPTALHQLVRATALPEAELRELLQGFVYRWLDSYVGQEGHMGADQLQESVDWLDGEMRQRLGSRPDGAYQRWKGSADNPLAFLFRVHR